MVSNIVKNKTDNFTLTSKIFDNHKVRKIINDDKVARELKNIECRVDTKKSFKALDESQQEIFLKEVLEFYKITTIYLLDKIPNRNLLKCCQYISPENIQKEESSKYIAEIAEKLPILNLNIDDVESEWRLLQLDEDIIFIRKEKERMDEYWYKIFSLKTNSRQRYPQVTKTVKAILSLIHGSAAVDRGFSESGLMLSENQANMHLRTLNSKLNTNDAAKAYCSTAHKVPITNDLIKRTKSAYSSYQLYLDNIEKMRKAQEKKDKEDAEHQAWEKAALEKLNSEVMCLKALEKEMEDSKKICKEVSANFKSQQKHLTATLRNKKKTSQSVLNELAASVDKFREKEKNARKAVDNLQSMVDKKRTAIINNKVK